jgi:hypothetical protein
MARYKAFMVRLLPEPVCPCPGIGYPTSLTLPTLSFADRDMFMRFYWKFAIGHAAIQERFGGSIRESDMPPSYSDLLPGLGLQDNGRDESDHSDSSSSDTSAGSSEDSESDNDFYV